MKHEQWQVAMFDGQIARVYHNIAMHDEHRVSISHGSRVQGQFNERLYYGMPTILVIGPYAFRFFALDRTEPRHIHGVHRDGRICKFWLDPDVRLANNRGYTAKEIRDIHKLVEAHADEFRSAWDTFFRP